MATLNPTKILRERKIKQQREQEASKIFDDRLMQILRDEKERRVLTEKLKTKGVEAKDLFLITQQLLRDKEETRRWIEGRGKDYNFKYLSDVTEKGSTFFKVMIVIRALIAEDIKENVPFKEAAQVILTRVLPG